MAESAEGPPEVAGPSASLEAAGLSGSLPAPQAAPPEALYVHVPFCVSLCPYCDFVVVAGADARGQTNRIGAYLAAVRRELELRADTLDRRWGPVGEGRGRVAGGHVDAGRPGTDQGRGGRRPLGSLYFGGGTPSLLGAEEVAEIVGLVRERFGLVPDAEITLEANPGPDERGDAAALAAAGITRISYGAQSLDDATLRDLGRRHRASDVAHAVAEARDGGIPSVNLDLLYDVPGGTINGWMATLESALDLEPDHLSLYALTLDDPEGEGLTGPTGDHLPLTRGARRWRDAARTGQDEDRAAAMYHHAVHRLGEAGYAGYEISNWARPGHESRHNLAYWERRPCEAVGPGAHAFDGATRRWNAARLDAYLAALTPPTGGPGQLPPGGEEPVDAATAAAERVILGLRTSRGIPAGAALEPPLADHFGWALAAELLEVTDDDRIVLTTRGRLLSNELFARLV